MTTRAHDRQRCTSRYEGKRGIVRCSKKAGHQQFAFSQKHISEVPGFVVSWTDEQAVKVAA